MSSILGQIQLGLWELGESSSGTAPGYFIGISEPTCTLTIEGGIPLRSYSAILGTIVLGKFELGALTTISTQAVLGNGNFAATASPTFAAVAFTDLSGTFVATASPTCSFATGISFVASAEPTWAVAAVLLPGFVAAANPRMRIFFDTNESQKDLVSDPLQISLKLVNFTY